MLIGITGKKRSGKDTIGEYLVAHHGYTKVGFADLVKQSIAALFGIDIEIVDRLKDEPSAEVDLTFGKHVLARMSFRHFIQRYATEAHRDVFSRDFWVGLLMDRVPEFTVICDVRFENEAQAIIDAEGVIWQVERPGYISEDTHESEAGIPDELITKRFINEGTIQDLQQQVEAEFIPAS